MKIVIYTQRVETIEEYQEKRDAADQRIPHFLYTCGYLPVPIPNYPQVMEAFVNRIRPDGILLTGGNSLKKYGGDAKEKDESDRKLIQMGIERDIPIYGFCRGMQSILDYFQIPLVQVENHVACKHYVGGEIGREVNSYHNYGCISIKDDFPFEILGSTSDGVIEAIRHKKHPIIGTMWHPEREMPFSKYDINMAADLFR